MRTFEETVAEFDVALTRESLQTIQVNLGRQCNQSCIHCHVEAGPTQTETMDATTASALLALVDEVKPETVDLTGGAPELCSSFRRLVFELSDRGIHVIDRSNLTVLLEEGMQDLPGLLAGCGVEIVASLPCYTKENVDAQRGQGVYDRSIEALRRLNGLGYGREGAGLSLNLVYNPRGADLPGPQQALEADYKRELMEREGVVFDHLYTITNMCLGRFARLLDGADEAVRYAELLSASFNPGTLSGLMCINQVSVSWDGRLYDCDFNQALGLPCAGGIALRLGGVGPAELAGRLIGGRISTGEHCWACTAGSGSSCGGALS